TLIVVVGRRLVVGGRCWICRWQYIRSLRSTLGFRSLALPARLHLRGSLGDLTAQQLLAYRLGLLHDLLGRRWVAPLQHAQRRQGLWIVAQSLVAHIRCNAAQVGRLQNLVDPLGFQLQFFSYGFHGTQLRQLPLHVSRLILDRHLLRLEIDHELGIEDRFRIRVAPVHPGIQLGDSSLLGRTPTAFSVYQHERRHALGVLPYPYGLQLPLPQ